MVLGLTAFSSVQKNTLPSSPRHCVRSASVISVDLQRVIRRVLARGEVAHRVVVRSPQPRVVENDMMRAHLKGFLGLGLELVRVRVRVTLF